VIAAASGSGLRGRRWQSWWRVAALVTCSVLVVLWLLIAVVGQEHSWTAKLVYLPPLTGPAFLLILAVPGWWWGRGHLVLLTLTAIFYLGPGLGWRTHERVLAPAPQRSELRLNVLTINRGQHHGHSIDAFVSAHQPDVLAIQDGWTPQAWQAGAPAVKELRHVVRLGEFLLASRYPIVASQLLTLQMRRPDASVRSWTHSARHELRIGERQIVVYNLHLPSPRFALTGQEGPAAIQQDYWAFQGQLLQELLGLIESESLPTVVLGDWNLPALGPRYRRMVERLADAHQVAGKGYGFTVPGDVRHWLAFDQPWLRLDYVLSSSHWQTERCVTEPRSTAQHAALFARLRLR
jgi:endonuclease/exonuclease/phosphatase family metal-dependent hydrolase